MLRLLVLMLISLLPAQACIWDRDTLRDEAKGKLDTVKAITGWFDRYPPRYYEMRLARVTEELKAKPDALDLYDDAGVACSRLGRHDESIIWMEKKKAVLDAKSPEETQEERYRYLSNIGTFYLIRWISQPEEVRSDDLRDLEASERFIDRALHLNPGAHFGREKFQLMLIRWLLNPGGVPEDGDINFLGVEQSRMNAPHDLREEHDFTLEEARKGITGLIQLGAAWESVDTFQTLQICLHAEKTMPMAHLAYLREKELYDAGRRSFHPLEDVRSEISPVSFPAFGGRERIESWFRKARGAADRRESAWLAYQEERFDQGMHPDTHPDFWKDWKEPEFPKLPGPSLMQLAEKHGGIALLLVCMSLGLLIWFLVQLLKKMAEWLDGWYLRRLQ